MNVLSANELLVFYHIPKCGGLTVSSLLAEKFPYEKIFNKKFKNIRTPGFKFDDFSYIRGHIHFCYNRCFPRKAKKITFLRHPVERVISHYWWNKVVVPLEISIETFYERHKNTQVKYLSSFSWKNPKISLKQHLESAKENLKNEFFFVGITERMDESLNTFYKMMGWEPLSQTPIFNSTIRSHDESNEFIDYVSNEEWADFELYHFANQLLDQFIENVEFVQKNPETVFVDQVHLTFDQAIEGEGWGNRCFDSKKKNYFRTSYLEKAFLYFPLRETHNYHLEFVASLVKGVNDLEVLINGISIPLFCDKNEEEWWNYYADIPHTLLNTGKTRVTFQVSNLQYDTSSNSRGPKTFGVSLLEVRIYPSDSHYAPVEKGVLFKNYIYPN